MIICVWHPALGLRRETLDGPAGLSGVSHGGGGAPSRGIGSTRQGRFDFLRRRVLAPFVENQAAPAGDRLVFYGGC